MQNISVFQKVEIAFWDRAIQLMSESRPVQALVREVMRTSQQSGGLNWIPVSLAAAACLGLCVGFLVGLMGIQIW